MLNAGIMTDEEFYDIIKSKEICVVDFSASWCGPCRMMAPILEDVSEKYKGKYYFYQIDIDSCENLAARCEISAVPTILVFKNGTEIARTSGYQEFEEFEKFLLDSVNKD